MRKNLIQRLGAFFVAGALTLGAGLALAGPAAAEQPDRYVFTNTGADLGGNIATKSIPTAPGEVIWSPGQWAAYDENSSISPIFVMAGNGYCVREVIRRANSTNPTDRTWTVLGIALHGSSGSRQPYPLAWTKYRDLNGGTRSLESRVSVVSC